MSRTSRLFERINVLRARRTPVTALYLARELGISQRSVYRDIETLRSLGAPLDGQAGIGYCLREGFFLPEFAFSSDELDALILGLGWVRQRADPALAQCSESALAAKIAASDGDIALTIVVQRAYNTGNALFLASLQAVLPAGQTFASIQLTYPENPFGNSSCQVWSVPTSDLSSTTAVSFGSAYDLAATVSTVTISSSAGGFILARAGKRGSRRPASSAGMTGFTLSALTSLQAVVLDLLEQTLRTLQPMHRTTSR